MFSVAGADQQIESATDFTRPLQRPVADAVASARSGSVLPSITKTSLILLTLARY